MNVMICYLNKRLRLLQREKVLRSPQNKEATTVNELPLEHEWLMRVISWQSFLAVLAQLEVGKRTSGSVLHALHEVLNLSKARQRANAVFLKYTAMYRTIRELSTERSTRILCG